MWTDTQESEVAPKLELYLVKCFGHQSVHERVEEVHVTVISSPVKDWMVTGMLPGRLSVPLNLGSTDQK